MAGAGLDDLRRPRQSCVPVVPAGAAFVPGGAALPRAEPGGAGCGAAALARGWLPRGRGAPGRSEGQVLALSVHSLSLPLFVSSGAHIIPVSCSVSWSRDKQHPPDPAPALIHRLCKYYPGPLISPCAGSAPVNAGHFPCQRTCPAPGRLRPSHANVCGATAQPAFPKAGTVPAPQHQAFLPKVLRAEFCSAATPR